MGLRILPDSTIHLGRGGLRVSGPSIAYLFHDEFSTDLAAGSINGTACEPGPTYNRAVTDANGKLSIVGGKLAFANGGSGFGNPGLWIDHAYASVGGMVLSAKAVVNHPLLMIGWSSAKSSALDRHSFFLQTTGGLGIYENNGAVNIIVGTMLVGIEHEYTIIRRANGGAWYFVQGGVYTSTEMVWANTYNTGSFYPGAIGSADSTAGVSTVEYLRIPQDVYIPSAAASDSFNRTNGAMGSTDGAGHADGVSGNGLAWTSQLGTWGIATNKAQASALDAGGMAIATVPTTKQNVFVENATLTRAGGIVGVVLRYVDADNYVIAGHDGTNAILIKRVAGVEATVGSTAAAFGAGKLTAMCSGTTFRLWWNNAVVGGGDLTIGDTALQASTIHGLYTTDTGNTFDNFIVWPRGS